MLLAGLALAGCSGAKPTVVPDPNPFPANYRRQVVTLLTTSLSERAAFVGAQIAPPVLKTIPGGQMPHYVVCLQLNSSTGPKTKAVIYLQGVPNEFIDAKPEECADAAYQPFGELQAAMPAR